MEREIPGTEGAPAEDGLARSSPSSKIPDPDPRRRPIASVPPAAHFTPGAYTPAAPAANLSCMRRNAARRIATASALTLLLTTAVKAEPPAGPPAWSDLAGFAAPVAADRHGLRQLFCLWQASGFGTARSERAGWVVRDPSGALRIVPWPFHATDRRETWRGPAPAGSLGVVHTHWKGDSTRPSVGDIRLAREIRLPVSVITRDGLVTARPDGTVVEEAGPLWFAAYAGRKGCDCSPEALRAATTIVAEAPAGSPDSPRSESAPFRSGE